MPQPRGTPLTPPRPPLVPPTKLPRSEYEQKLAVPAPETPVATGPALTAPESSGTDTPTSVRPPLSQRLGNVGIILLAVLAGIVAYCVSAWLSPLLNIK
jgi:hypothetical protein